MNKKTILTITSIIVILLIVTLLALFLNQNNNSDALKFKKEYESLNNIKKENSDVKYNSISIDENNPIKYVDTKEALKVLDMDNVILYVGANWCPWCRNAVPVLFEVSKKYKVDTIYYLNLDDEKSSFEIKDGKLVKTVDGTESYYELLDRLSDRLRDYKLSDKDNNEYDTGEKRIYMPYVLGIKDGKVINDHIGTVDLNDNQTAYDKLTDEQNNELIDIYSNIFDDVFGINKDTCKIDEECN